MFGNVDHGENMCKQVYSIDAPLIDHYAGQNNGLHANIMKGLNGYDTIRSQAMEHHDRHCDNIRSFF